MTEPYKLCLGYGPYDRRWRDQAKHCTNEATVAPAYLWCERCEKLRRETIRAQMVDLAKSFESAR